MKNDYFIKYMRNPQLVSLFKKRPTALLLLLLIVERAKNNEESGDPDLNVGEALIGDFQTYGVTEQIYRSDKNFLKKYQILTFKSTSKGTVAKLKNRDYFDVEWKKPTIELTTKLTDNQRTTNGQLTTNREIRNKKYILSPALSNHKLWETAVDMRLPLELIIQTHSAVLDPINAEKYKYSDVNRTLRKWLARDIKNGTELLDNSQMEYLKAQEPK